jgi:hypothetical protein
MSRSGILYIVLLIIAATVVYANSLGGDFVYDDKPMITAYEFVQNIGNVPAAFVSPTSIYGNVNYYRPLQTVSYMVDYFLWGELPAGFHATNILFHVLAVLLVYVFIMTLFKEKTVAFIAALMFAVHPVHTTVVSYIAGRADAMLCVFTLGALTLYMRFRYEGNGIACYALSVVFFVLALMTKETAMIIPVVIALFDGYGRQFTRLRTEPRPGSYQSALWLILAAYILFRMMRMSFFVEGAMAPFPFGNRLATAPYNMAQYLRLTFLPNDLHMGRQPWIAGSLFEEKVIVSIIVIALVAVFAYRSRKSAEPVWFGLCWFTVMIFPTLNIITPLFYTVAENWLYIPSIGLFLAIAWLAKRAYEKLSSSGRPVSRYVVVAAVAAYILVMAVITVDHNKVWKDEIALGMNALRFSPREFKIYNNIGVEYLSRGNLDEAEEYFWKCLEIKPDTGMAYFNLYRVYTKRGNRAKAVQYLNKARQLDPQRVGILVEKMDIKD